MLQSKKAFWAAPPLPNGRPPGLVSSEDVHPALKGMDWLSGGMGSTRWIEAEPPFALKFGLS